ncbi:glycosyltransferase family 4 protein [Paragemmobacter straminiformis]|uniref:Glycosyltransferase family 4 protein n=1 Tax=Paragemmobacter straminiformis TaxID=2045119 RepID=A0A842IC46_9RHOB|nr:glycosyltransferase family 4 protein [Gemmobacter straminiformis]MBC2836558.1 glycosyltransferase family 4 protein [Gemmobacter straminiformis]
MPALFVTNFNPRFTGVSATAAAVLATQKRGLDAVLVGHPLPDCPAPVPVLRAFSLSRNVPKGLPFAIWHVRRNAEMLAALVARDILRLPVRIVFTSAAQRRHSALPRWLISRMDAVVATTPLAAALVPHVRAVVPHGVDTARFTPAADRAKAWAATGFPGAYGIVTVGRIRNEKGTDLFVKAMIRALPHLPQATAVVLGMAKPAEADFLTTLRAEIAAAGLTDRILFPGEVPSDAMPGILRGAALLMALPRYEGYGMTPLEAMACGVPVIASQAGHFAEFVGKTAGEIVAQEDWAGAADAAIALLSDPARHAAAAAAARDRATGLFGIEAEVAGIRSVYDSLWKAAPSTGRA